MIVCFCAASNERDVQQALDAGARSLCEIGDRCSAGLDCGLCHETLLTMLRRRSCHGETRGHSLSTARSAGSGF